MNPRVGIYALLALVWLGLTCYFFFVSEPKAFNFVDAHVAGTLSAILCIWNAVRAGMYWQRPNAEPKSHDRPV